MYFSKLLKDDSRTAEKQKNFLAALEYGLLVHKNVLENRRDHFKIVLGRIVLNSDLEEISILQ
jgi:hypothetical protein